MGSTCIAESEGGLGVQRHQTFKFGSAWQTKLMTNPTSMCAWVLKGKYFSSTDFFQATSAKYSSATWHAIIAGSEALQTGWIKRIGDGASASIWVDKWIHDTLSRTQVTQIGNAQLTKVCQTVLIQEIGVGK